MTRLRRWIPTLTLIGFAVLCWTLVASPALAGITGDALTIIATTPTGDVAELHIPVPAGPPPWIWESDQTIEMRSEVTGDLLFTLNPPGYSSKVEYFDDPVVGVTFAGQAGPLGGIIFITSGVLSFPTISPAEGRASAGFSLTDLDGDGATLTGIGDPNGSQGAYLAQYNGDASSLSGTTFAEFIQSMSTGSFQTTTVNDALPALGFLPIGDPVSDMSVLIHFALSANDLVSGTSVWTVQAPPTSVEAASWGGIKGLYR